jgi:addiction module HigA family antidote
VVREEFVKHYELSARKLAEQLDVPANRITEIMAERRSITADTAIQLSRFFGTTREFWMNLQAAPK